MKAKILLVEDNQDISYALHTMLQYSGYETEAITDGNETYAKVKEFKPDLILLDVLLSGSDGPTIAKNLKKEETTKNICILMMSAHPSGERMALESGADYFLEKPFDVNKLLENIEKSLDISSKQLAHT